MRITAFSIFNQLTRSLRENMNLLSKLSDRLSSGKKIAKPSDDVPVMMRSMDYKISINDVHQFGKNIDEAEGYLGSAETTMSSVTNALTRAREIAMQGANGTESAESRLALSQEVAGLRDQVLSLANSAFRGRYIFSGYKTDTEAFDSSFNYQGDSGTINVTIDGSASVAVNIPGDTAFSAGGATYFETLDDLYTALVNNDQAAIQTSISEIDGAIDQAGLVRADIGGRLNHLDSLKINLDDRDLNLQTLLSNTEDDDITETASEIAKTQVALEALRASGVNMLSRSLFDFLK